MTELAINYIANPFAGLIQKLMRSAEIVGYARAASHLSSMGYYEEAKRCMLMANELRAKTNSNLKGWV